MSRNGQVVLATMEQLIDEYLEDRISLRRLVDDLRSMYDSLSPEEQPPEREWLDGFVPLDRLLSDRSPEDHATMQARIEGSLARLRKLIAARRASGAARAATGSNS
ncbi:MAG TPA: hypothetical protein VFP98_10595 [Candidatus Polarisedimenticolia bacterium]|nr:hypothetical protein [Candidatus Polarisedimenticolia bacterium]